MNFYYESDGIVRPWITPGIIPYADPEAWRLALDHEEEEWKRWHAKHELVRYTEAGKNTVKTIFSGLGETLGMFYVTVCDVNGKEVEYVQCHTMEKALSVHYKFEIAYGPAPNANPQ